MDIIKPNTIEPNKENNQESHLKDLEKYNEDIGNIHLFNVLDFFQVNKNEWFNDEIIEKVNTIVKYFKGLFGEAYLDKIKDVSFKLGQPEGSKIDQVFHYVRLLKQQDDIKNEIKNYENYSNNKSTT